MRPTPTERLALAAARRLTALALEGAAALSEAPDLQSFPRRHDRLRLAQTRLVWAAEAWHQRELRLALYRRALREADRTEAARQRVTALDVPTRRIRQDLIRHHRALLEAEDAAFRLF